MENAQTEKSDHASQQVQAPDFGRSALIVGYGREGQSIHRYLLQHGRTRLIAVADKAQIKLIPQAPPESVAYSGITYLKDIAKYETVIRSPGINVRLLKSAGLTAEQHLTSASQIFFENCPGTIIGITGTKGKSTTSALIAALLKSTYADVRLAGNIGVPMIDALVGASSQTIFVLELSSFQLENLHFSPKVAVVLGVENEHLDYHESFDQYLDAKRQIAKHQQIDDLIIFNPSRAGSLLVASQSSGTMRTFGSSTNDTVVISEGRVCIQGPEGLQVLLKCAELQLMGPGNLQNIMAATTCALHFKVSLENIAECLRRFCPLEHRLEFVSCVADINFYNDSLATVPPALINAIAALGGSLETLIAGGHDRGLSFLEVGPAISQSNIKNLILFPTTGEKIWQAVQRAHPQTDIRKFVVDSMEQAVALAFLHTPKGKTCILSPGSASFGMFRDYKDRGDQFRNAVLRRGLKHGCLDGV